MLTVHFTHDVLTGRNPRQILFFHWSEIHDLISSTSSKHTFADDASPYLSVSNLAWGEPVPFPIPALRAGDITSFALLVETGWKVRLLSSENSMNGLHKAEIKLLTCWLFHSFFSTKMLLVIRYHVCTFNHTFNYTRAIIVQTHIHRHALEIHLAYALLLSCLPCTALKEYLNTLNFLFMKWGRLSAYFSINFLRLVPVSESWDMK